MTELIVEVDSGSGPYRQLVHFLTLLHKESVSGMSYLDNNESTVVLRVGGSGVSPQNKQDSEHRPQGILLKVWFYEDEVSKQPTLHLKEPSLSILIEKT